MRYSVRALGAAEARASVLELWQRLGIADAGARFDWAHGDGSRLFLLDAHDGTTSRVVGMVAIEPREVFANGRRLSAALLGGFRVEKAHRTFFPALSLQRAVTAWARSEFDLVYGFPNESAAPIMKKLGFRPLLHLSRHALLLRHARQLEEIVDGRALCRVLAAPLDAYRALSLWRPREADQTFASITSADARFDRLFAARAFADWTCGGRDPRLVVRRLLGRPDERTTVHALSERGELSAWVAVHRAGDVAFVRDLQGRDVRAMATALRLASLESRAAGCSSVSLLCAAPPALRDALAALGFRARPSSRVMIGLAGERLATDPTGASTLAALERWYATEADEDQ